MSLLVNGRRISLGVLTGYVGWSTQSSVVVLRLVTRMIAA
jgi:hypothetical protein